MDHLVTNKMPDSYVQSVNQVIALKSNLSEKQIEALNLDALVSGAQGLASAYENIDLGINNSKVGASSISDGAEFSKQYRNFISRFK